jgi:hypothetical protein
MSYVATIGSSAVGEYAIETDPLRPKRPPIAEKAGI